MSHPGSNVQVSEFGSRSNVNTAGSSPNITGMGYFVPVQSTGVVPKVKVNNEEMGQNSPQPPASPYNSLRKILVLVVFLLLTMKEVDLKVVIFTRIIIAPLI